MKNNIKHIIREQRKTHKWPVALLLLMFALYHLVLLPFALNSTLSAGQYQGTVTAKTLENLQQIAVGFLGSSFRSWIPILASMILTIDSFGYLFHKQQIDFYESQPIARSVRFRGLCLYNILVFVGGMLLTFIPAMAIAYGFGAMTPVGCIAAMISVLRDLVLFLGLSGFCLLAVMLTGNVIVCILANFSLLLFQPMISVIISEMQDCFLKTSYDAFSTFHGFKLSPYYLYFISDPGVLGWKTEKLQDPASLMKHLGSSGSYMVMGLVRAAVMYGISYLFYINRKNESAGTSVVFAWVRSVVRVLISYIVATEAGIFIFYAFQDELGTTTLIAYMAFFMILAAVITAAIMQIIYEQDFHGILHRLPELLLCAIVPLALMVGGRLVANIYDRQVPNENLIKAVSFCDRSNIPNLIDENGHYIGDSDYLESNAYFTSPEDIRDILKLAKDGQSYTIEATDQYGWPKNGKDEDVCRFVVFYQMKTGATVRRKFSLPKGMDTEELERLTKSEAYFDTIYPLRRYYEIAGEKKLQLTHYKEKGKDEHFVLSGEEREELLTAFQNDVLRRIDVYEGEGTRTYGDSNVTVRLEYAGDDDIDDIRLEIHPEDQNTRAFLERHGMKL